MCCVALPEAMYCTARVLAAQGPSGTQARWHAKRIEHSFVVVKLAAFVGDVPAVPAGAVFCRKDGGSACTTTTSCE